MVWIVFICVIIGLYVVCKRQKDNDDKTDSFVDKLCAFVFRLVKMVYSFFSVLWESFGDVLFNMLKGDNVDHFTKKDQEVTTPKDASVEDIVSTTTKDVSIEDIEETSQSKDLTEDSSN